MVRWRVVDTAETTVSVSYVPPIPKELILFASGLIAAGIAGSLTYSLIRALKGG